ncbi:MAG: hypothetical protein KGL39_54755 [Patescibacteria group bacterium]|nr:hypothetical protein [Patescibacteria group bacterium]
MATPIEKFRMPNEMGDPKQGKRDVSNWHDFVTSGKLDKLNDKVRSFHSDVPPPNKEAKPKFPAEQRRFKYA